MENVVTRVAERAGGLKPLAKIFGVSYQAAWLWERNGYFPLKRMKPVIALFPGISAEQLADAYQFRHQRTTTVSDSAAANEITKKGDEL